MATTSTIRHLLKQNRLKAGATVRTRAAELGVSFGTLSGIENGPVPIGPTVLGRMLVILSDAEAAELVACYLQERVERITSERDRLISTSGLRPDARQLRVESRVHYSKLREQTHGSGKGHS